LKDFHGKGIKSKQGHLGHAHQCAFALNEWAHETSEITSGLAKE
jgi:hypothetical protein